MGQAYSVGVLSVGQAHSVWGSSQWDRLILWWSSQWDRPKVREELLVQGQGVGGGHHVCQG